MKHRPGTRLFQSLEQGVLRGGHHRVRLVDDYGPSAPLERPVVGAVDHVAYLVDLDRAGVARLEDDDVRVDATRDTPARGTRAARVDLKVTRRAQIETIQRLGGRERHPALTDALWPRQQQRRRQRTPRNRPREQRQYSMMTDQRLERHGSGYQVAGFRMTCDSSIKTSICVIMKQRYASSGVQTIGSSLTLNEVFTMTGQPVNASKARMMS